MSDLSPDAVLQCVFVCPSKGSCPPKSDECHESPLSAWLFLCGAICLNAEKQIAP